LSRIIQVPQEIPTANLGRSGNKEKTRPHRQKPPAPQPAQPTKAKKGIFRKKSRSQGLDEKVMGKNCERVPKSRRLRGGFKRRRGPNDYVAPAIFETQKRIKVTLFCKEALKGYVECWEGGGEKES